MKKAPEATRAKLLAAALRVIRTQGYAATRVDDICAEARVSKGSFFHHFATKEELAVAAAEYFSDAADTLFARAPYQQITDPVQRLLGYIDFRESILKGELADYTCLLGTMVQEAYATSPAIREACEKYLSHHAKTLADEVARAKAALGREAPWSAESMGLFIQAVIQGSFILAKSKGSADVAVSCFSHVRRYIEQELTPKNQTSS